MSNGPILVFACRWCSLLGAERAARERLPLPDGIRLIPVECAGGVSAETVIEALLNGASGVAVLGCHLGGCRHNDANRDAHARLNVLSELLDAVGLDGRRLLISWGEAHEAKGYSNLLQNFALSLKKTTEYHATYNVTSKAGAVVQQKLFFPSSEQDAELRAKASAALKAGRRVLALHATPSGAIPALFTEEKKLEHMTAGPKHPIAKIFCRILRDMAAGELKGDWAEASLRSEILHNSPERPISVACRPCDARALKQLASLHQFSDEDFDTLRIECSEEQKALCDCHDASWPGDSSPEKNISSDSASAINANAEFWQKEFSRCVQCHWCQNACPVCICPSCSLESNAMLPAGFMPPSPLGYHLVRAMHVADSCVSCGACQDACPQGLPLLRLHKAVSAALKKTGYSSGHGMESPMQSQKLIADKDGSAVPRWGCGLPVNTQPSSER